MKAGAAATRSASPATTPGGGTALPSVCLVAPGAFGLLAERPDLRPIGGAEVQQLLVARELARRGHEVTVVTGDLGELPEPRPDGIRVLQTCRPEAGLPVVRFVHPRWSSLWRALSRAGADVYYQRSAGAETGQVALWCRLHRRPFVFAAASLSDCLPSTPFLTAGRERLLYRYGLRAADAVVCQTEAQRDALPRDRPSRLIRSSAEDPFPRGLPPRTPPSPAAPRALWVGRLTPPKRFELLLELARRSPAVGFDVVGGAWKGDGYGEGLEAQARNLGNVHLHGWLPHSRVGPFYDQAAALVCTSPMEGFPNTFLEAWARGTPVLTTVDPDGIVQGNDLGHVAGSAEDLRSGLETLVASPEVWLGRSARVRSHFLQHHALSTATDAYQALLAALVSSPDPRGGATP